MSAFGFAGWLPTAQPFQRTLICSTSVPLLYWYQFIVGNEYSMIGRTRTAPIFGSAEALRFAFVSCQHYAQGYYYAHKHLAEESLDFAVHLGDYIYEREAASSIGRPHLPNHEITSIEDYRIRSLSAMCRQRCGPRSSRCCGSMAPRSIPRALVSRRRHSHFCIMKPNRPARCRELAGPT